MRRERILEFDGLRGILAWWVAIGHLILFVTGWLNDRIPVDAAVQVFIILSGFVISDLLFEKRESYLVFLRRRLARLYPAYLVCLLVSAATLHLQRDALLYTVLVSPKNASRLHVFETHINEFWPQLSVHFTMLHGLVPHDVLFVSSVAFLGQAWSISTEWQFYLIAPAIFYGFVAGGLWRLLAFAAVGGLFLLRQFPGFEGDGGFLPNVIVLFVLGSVSFACWRFADRRLAAFVCVSVTLVGIYQRDAALGVWAIVLAAVIFRDFGYLEWVRRALRSPLLVHLGNISYSTYLVHGLAIYFGMLALNAFGLSPTVYFVILVPITVVGTWALSELLYRYVEVPGQKLGRRESTFRRVERA